MNAVRARKERKMEGLALAKYYVVLVLAACKDQMLPMLQRCAMLSIYICLLYFTYNINKTNLENMAVKMFSFLIFFASLAGFLEFAIPAATALFLVFAIVLVRKRMKEEKAEGNRFKGTADRVKSFEPPKPSLRALVGQVVHGIFL